MRESLRSLAPLGVVSTDISGYACKMFTLVIWTIGLCKILFIAALNIGLIRAAFEKHAFPGVPSVELSLVFWKPTPSTQSDEIERIRPAL